MCFAQSKFFKQGLLSSLRGAIPFCFFVLFLCLNDPCRSQVIIPGTTAFTPDDPFFDYSSSLPNTPGQWTLKNTAPSSIGSMSNAGIDANVSGAWQKGLTGQGIVIGIVDDGVDGTHPDLSANYSSSLSKNFSDPAYDNLPQGPMNDQDNHATAVAGIAAGRGGNGIGITGVAPYATIAGLRLGFNDIYGMTAQNMQDAYFWGTNVNPSDNSITGDPQIQVKNHSYGYTTPFYEDGANHSAFDAISPIANNGVINVFAAGNSRGDYNQDAGTQFLLTNPDDIAVAALGSDGKFATYSNFGANVFVTAPSSSDTGFGVTTTDRAGSAGYNTGSGGDLSDTNYTNTFSGTSAAAPLVSGVMALGKQLDPFMDVRMAKHILVRTSVEVDPTDASASSFGGWQTNGAGYHFDPNYGFGNIDATAFITELTKVAYVTESSSIDTGTVSPNVAIPTSNAAGVDETFNQASLTGVFNQPIESVEVYVNIQTTDARELQVKLTSPSGMISALIQPTTAITGSAINDLTWTFLSNAFWGEDGNAGSGTWTLNVSNPTGSTAATWHDYKVTFIMGDLVLNSLGTNTINADVDARSLLMALDGSTLIIANGHTFTTDLGAEVVAGQMDVEGTLTDGASKNAKFLVNGGTLSGAGTLTTHGGLYQTAGTIEPGNGAGSTMTVNGNYNQTGGTLLIDIASALSYSKLTVNGTASLSGGIVQANLLGGYVPTLGTEFSSVLSATSLSGTFSSASEVNLTPTIVLMPQYDYTNGIVNLSVVRDYNNPNLYPYLTPNGRSVGNMLSQVAPSATGDLSTVLSAIDSISSYTSIANAIEQLAPIGGAAPISQSFALTGLQTSNFTQRSVEIRQQNGMFRSDANLRPTVDTRNFDVKFDDGILNGVCLRGLYASQGYFEPSVLWSDQKSWRFFVNGNGTMVNRGNTSSQLGYDLYGGGISVGADYRLADCLTVGSMLGYSGSTLTLDDAGSKVNVNGASLGVYGIFTRNHFYLNGMASAGWNLYDMRRRIVFPGVDRTATSSPNGQQITLYGGTGIDFPIDNHWSIGPTLSTQYTSLYIDKYTETGADSLDLVVNNQHASSLLSSAGMRVSYLWKAKSFTVLPDFNVALQHEFANNERIVTARFAQGASVPFTTQTADTTRTTMVVGLGATVNLYDDWSVGGHYETQLGDSNLTSHSIDASVSYLY